MAVGASGALGQFLEAGGALNMSKTAIVAERPRIPIMRQCARAKRGTLKS